jgi:hypothetical protein
MDPVMLLEGIYLRALFGYLRFCSSLEPDCFLSRFFYHYCAVVDV